MPGAPNKPPTIEGAPPTPATEGGEKRQHALRRLAPDRLVLRLPIWRGPPSPDLVKPLERVAQALGSGEFPEAERALDQFSVRLAEPRWPTIPEPWVRLRVSIPAPQPPHWDPDFKLTSAERETKRTQEWADTQIRLLRATLDLAPSLKVDLADVAPRVDEAEAVLGREGPGPAFWSPVDHVWEAVEARVSLPVAAARPAPAAKLPPGIAPEEA